MENISAGEVSREERYVLSMEHITKVYGNGFIANKDITFRVRKGEIHGLVGENGAGKTTLMKVLFGLEVPEEGQVFVDGEAVAIHNPQEALKFGIGLVHQHFMLVESMTVAENMVLGIEPVRGLSFDLKKAVRLTDKISEDYHLPIQATAKVKDLSVGYKQRVELLKMLLRGVKILLLDEPTAVLTPQETKELFVQLKKLKSLGFTIVFISHKLNEIKEICDNITVLRRGRVVNTCAAAEVDEREISRMMVGRDVALAMDKKKAVPKDEILRIEGVSHVNKFGAKVLNHVSFCVRRGEIVGVAGVEGNGQAELAEMICGLLPVQDGDILVKGKSIKGQSIKEIRNQKVSFIHEDRMVFGVSKNQTVAENVISDRFDKPGYYKGPFLTNKKIRRETKELIGEFTIACTGMDAEVKTLSGGNIQKVVAAREYSSAPDLLIASQITRGIDVGATELVRKKLIALRDHLDTGVLLFSADLNEILTVSDSIIVLFGGEIAAYFPDAQAVDEMVLGEYMLGLKKMAPEEMREVYR
ncbi:MAG: ABC transporter ATP-binding protein [Lachnospiraceae bacterium]|nr:ABC transporter ATP-binding protein [Lachnospiraceae bacterium]